MENGKYHVRQPLLALFSEKELEGLHYAGLEILEDSGVDVHHDQARKLLHEAGAHVNGINVKIPAGLVKQALDSVPERIMLADRNRNRVMPLEGCKVYFGTGSDLINTIDLETGERRLSKLNDVAMSATLCDALPNIDFLMSYALPHDVPEDKVEVYQTAEMLKHSSKPIIMTVCNDKQSLKDIIDLCAMVAGGMDELQKNPFLCIYGQFVSPLVHTVEAVDRLMTCADYRIPIIYVPTIMAGMSGPATMAGALAVGNAEVLAGIVMSQLKRKGAPFVYGGCISSFDMSKMILPYGAPEWHMASAILAQMAQKYRLPVFSTAGCSDSKIPDEQAVAEASMSLLLAGLSGANLIHDVGYLESGMTGSLHYLAMCDELIGYVRRVLRNFDVNETSLALDVMSRVGPGGSFIGEQHTFDHYKSETWYPGLWNRDIHDTWQKQGQEGFSRKARQKAIHILRNHQPEPLDKKIRQEMDDFIRNL
ncbi:MAG: trimethylamine methyltransferase family protein [Clostridia bacterium]